MIRMIVPLFAIALIASVPALATEYVPLPHFNGVQLRGGGDVVLVPGPDQRVTVVEGSTQFTRLYVDRQGTLKIDACDRNCPRQYRLRIEIQSPHVPVLAVDGGGEINVARGFGPERELVAAVNDVVKLSQVGEVPHVRAIEKL